MIVTTGNFLKETLISLGLTSDEKSQATSTAERIVSKIINSYESVIGQGHIGPNGRGVPQRFSSDSLGPIGLVYGRIQSGKTRAMIVSTAMAFDNGFRIALVLTSNINDLVTQTHLDFIKDLKGVSVFTKDDELRSRVDEAKLDLENPEGRILIITSKGGTSLKNITDFLNRVQAKSFPILIFDDEGDQASLDNNVYKRSSTGDFTLQPSQINKLIKKIRKDFPASVYVYVTGTPQAVLLQGASSDNRPSFVEMLPHGDGYIGGDYFFNTDELKDNPHKLISEVPNDDKTELLKDRAPIPEGLKDSIVFFLLAASAAVKNIGFPEKPREKDKGYQYLCHPSLKNNEQGQAATRIQGFLTEIKGVLMGHPDNSGINAAMAEQYAQLKNQLGADLTPSMDDLKAITRQELLRKKVLVINAKNNKRQGIEYGPGFNFLIGGNTLGRGIAIPNLLVTYYVRIAKASQIDTMHQHARMFGYRSNTLKYTRLFTTEALYYRFRDIHFSDTGLRDFIVKHSDSFPNSFPVELSNELKATRKSVLDVNTTDTVWPGMQIYPNYIKLPQPQRIHDTIMRMIAADLGLSTTDLNAMVTRGRTGVIISALHAIDIVTRIQTKSKNSWQDKTISSVIQKLAQRLGQNVRLKFRRADRKVSGDGFLSSGTLSGQEQAEGRADSMPTLWIMSVTGRMDSGDQETFAYPTIVIPDTMPQVFVFSKN